jgi:hypothetical protein
MSAVIAAPKTGRSLVAASVFDMLAERVARDEQVDPALAVRIVDQALAFLGTCAVSDIPLSPSAAVDPGWHAFILHTHEYTMFCERVAGSFIHHVPNDENAPAAHGVAARAALERTKAEIVRAGFVLDEELWQPSGVDCSQCHNGCTDSPATADHTRKGA